MRAARCHRHGPPSVVRIDHVPDPAASAGQVVVDVEVASVNYPDVLLVAGGYQTLPPLPFVVGGEFAGTISEVGADVTGFAVGDRVFGVSGFGAFAERIAVDAQALRRIPDGLDATSAAAFSVTYETAYHSLRSVAQVRPGETVVVLGAAGGVGSAAVEIAVSLGARVIAAAGSPERLEFCASLGAHEVVDYQRTGRLRPRVTASFPLDRVRDALQAVADRRVSGKAVVSVGRRDVQVALIGQRASPGQYRVYAARRR
jgi:NADPH:quinone reductase